MVTDRGLQSIIGSALISHGVRTKLLSAPWTLMGQFNLTTPERRFLVRVRPRDLEQFAEFVEHWRGAGPAGGQRVIGEQSNVRWLAG